MTVNPFTKATRDGTNGTHYSPQRLFFNSPCTRFERPLTEKGHARFDLYPDVSDYPPSEAYPVPGLTLPDSQQARLFSSRNPGTTKRHFHMMAEHGIDGAFLMRQANECEVDGDSWSPLANLMRVGDEVLDGVRASAEVEGRVWAIM